MRHGPGSSFPARRPVAAAVSSGMARLAVLAGALLACAAGGGCGTPGRAPAARFIEQAERLHDGALASTVTPDEDLNAYIEEIGKRLEAAAQDVAPDKARGRFFRTMRFHLVDVPIINAFTTGGSHVYVYRGLFDYCNSEEELAAAMAHVYAHALNLDVEGTGLNPGDPGRPLRLVAWEFVANRFTLEQERAADELAFRLYARAGWDPALFEVLFTRLSDPGSSGGGTAAATGTAPDRQPLATRGARARRDTAGVSKQWRQFPVADPRTFEALSEHAESLRHASPAAAGGNTEALLYLVAFPNCILPDDLPAQREAQDLLRPEPPPAVEVEPS